MKKNQIKLLVTGALLVCTLGLVGCGNASKPAVDELISEDETSYEAVVLEDETVYEDLVTEEESSPIELENDVAVIYEELDIVEYVKDTYPDITIGEDRVLTDQGISGEELAMVNNASCTLSEDWVFFYEDPALGFKRYSYLGETKTVASVVLNVSWYVATVEKSDAEFAEFMKALIAEEKSNTLKTINNFSHITVNGYEGYYLEVDTTSTSYQDLTAIYINVDGYVYSFTIFYSNEDIDPAIKEAGVASAMNVVSSFVRN